MTRATTAFGAKWRASPDVEERDRAFWREGYDADKQNHASAQRLLSRLSALFRPPLSDVLSTPSVRLSEALNASQRIVVFDLSRLRGHNADITGQLILAQLQQAIESRGELPEDKRLPYHLYIDEFQKYAGESEKSLIELLNRARKRRLSVTLAHQVISDIPDKLFNSIMGNVGTLIVLNVPSPSDATLLAKRIQLKDWQGHIDAVQIQNLSQGEAFVVTPKQKSAVYVQVPAAPILCPEEPDTEKPTYPEALKATSKATYGLPLRRGAQPTPSASPSSPPPTSEEGGEFKVF